MAIPAKPLVTQSITAYAASGVGGVPEHNLKASPILSRPCCVFTRFIIVLTALEMALSQPGPAVAKVFVAAKAKAKGEIPLPGI